MHVLLAYRCVQESWAAWSLWMAFCKSSYPQCTTIPSAKVTRTSTAPSVCFGWWHKYWHVAHNIFIPLFILFLIIFALISSVSGVVDSHLHTISVTNIPDKNCSDICTKRVLTCINAVFNLGCKKYEVEFGHKLGVYQLQPDLWNLVKGLRWSTLPSLAANCHFTNNL